MYKFELYKDDAGEFRVRFKYGGDIIMSSEGYTDKRDAMRAIDIMREKAPDAVVRTIT